LYHFTWPMHTSGLRHKFSTTQAPEQTVSEVASIPTNLKLKLGQVPPHTLSGLSSPPPIFELKTPPPSVLFANCPVKNKGEVLIYSLNKTPPLFFTWC